MKTLKEKSVFALCLIASLTIAVLQLGFHDMIVQGLSNLFGGSGGHWYSPLVDFFSNLS